MRLNYYRYTIIKLNAAKVPVFNEYILICYATTFPLLDSIQ